MRLHRTTASEVVTAIGLWPDVVVGFAMMQQRCRIGEAVADVDYRPDCQSIPADGYKPCWLRTPGITTASITVMHSTAAVDMGSASSAATATIDTKGMGSVAAPQACLSSREAQLTPVC